MDREQVLPEKLSDYLGRYSPDYLIIPFDYHIPLYTSDAMALTARLVELAAQSGVRTIVGGRPATCYPERFLFGTTVIVCGEVELGIKELLSLESWNEAALGQIVGIIFKANQHITKTARRREHLDLDLLPIPDRSFLDLTPYIDVRSMLSSRGCVERCGFCPVPTFWGNWRARSPKLVVDEIEYLAKTFSARKILFLDDHAMVDTRRLQAIAQGVLERKINTTLGCLGTVRCADPKTLELMYRAGFRWIHYGAEFGDDAVLQTLRKRISVKQITQAIELTKAAGLRVRTSWIFDAPGATTDGLRRTCDLILESEPEEVRAHFLALRALSPFATEIGGESQYIHADRPRQHATGLNSEQVLEQVDRLTLALITKGYRSVKKPDQWGDLNGCSKFISFCPGRYGIGWSI